MCHVTAMKGRLTFLFVMPKTGKKRQFSLHTSILYVLVIVSLMLLASGIIGMFKYQENIHLKNRCKLLEAEKNKMEAIARTVQDIEREEAVVKKMLGLDLPKKNSNMQRQP